MELSSSGQFFFFGASWVINIIRNILNRFPQTSFSTFKLNDLKRALRYQYFIKDYMIIWRRFICGTLRRICILIYLLILLAGTSTQAGNPNQDLPASVLFPVKNKLDFINAGNRCKSKLSFNERNKPGVDHLKTLAFADSYLLDLNPSNSGLWEKTKHIKIWRLALSSPAAYSIYLSFSTLELSDGVSLFVYNENYEKILGPYTSKKVNPKHAFSIPPITGDKVIIELNIPSGISDYGNLLLNKLYHDRLDVFKKNIGSATLAGSCDQNINCDNGTYWQTEKRSVCKIITDGALCTGTLLGNTSKNSQPYLLTAYHTIFDEKHAQEAVFIFNYEELKCSTGSINDAQTVSGASLLASAEGQDYALLKLNELPPAAFKPYYAGWNIDENINPPGVTIHHPYGIPKQIAIGYQNLKSASFNNSYHPDAFWEVKWNLGSTAPGSSGAPLFNKQHQLIGSLTGGTASCNSGGYDYFNKLSSAWTNLKGQGVPLIEILDSAATGLSAINGYDPYGFSLSYCNIAWNILKEEILITDNEPANALNKSLMFAEKFSGASALALPNVYFNIAALDLRSNLDHIKLKIWEGSFNPGRELYSKTVFLKDLKPGINEIGLDSLVKTSGDFFIGYEPGNTQVNQFLLFRTTDRGPLGASSMYVFNEGWKNASLESKAYHSSLAIGISECYGKIYPPKSPEITSYPIPASTYLDFQLPDQLLATEVKCFDTSGKELKVLFVPSELKSTVYFSLPQGIYFLQVKTARQTFHTKFTVIRDR